MCYAKCGDEVGERGHEKEPWSVLRSMALGGFSYFVSISSVMLMMLLSLS